MKMDRFKDIRAIAFDADDTLWAFRGHKTKRIFKREPENDGRT